VYRAANGKLSVTAVNPEPFANAWSLHPRLQSIQLFYRKAGLPSWSPAGSFTFTTTPVLISRKKIQEIFPHVHLVFFRVNLMIKIRQLGMAIRYESLPFV
jgi:hypothetical protein